MKYYEIYFLEELKGKNYKSIIDYAFLKSDSFSLARYTDKNDLVQYEIDSIRKYIYKIENCYDGTVKAIFYFTLNDSSRQFLYTKKAIFDFYILQDLCFYKNNKIWFMSLSHENQFCMRMNENEVAEFEKLRIEFKKIEI